MKIFSVIFPVVFSLLVSICGPAWAGWSLLEDDQMQAVAGEEGICVPGLKQECDFDVRRYGVDYADYENDLLVDDIEIARDKHLEMIYTLSLPDAAVPSPQIIIPVDQHSSRLGGPFFESRWYSPGMSGWEALVDQALSLF